MQLAHASKLETIAQARTKTDSVDAPLLARMLAGGLIPEVYARPPAQREICRLAGHRRRLVGQRTRLAGRIVARTATARKLARIIHAMLSNDEAWRG